METLSVGHKIKTLRQSLGLSQRDLAEGICTQALISHIEKNKTTPTVDVFFNIAKKLGAPADYFLETHDNSLDYILEVQYQIRKQVQEHNYEEALNIIKTERKNPIFNNSKYLQFLLWHEAICEYSLNKRYNEAVEAIEEALKLTHKEGNSYSEREIEILISLANFHDSEKKYDLSTKIYQDINDSLKALSYLSDRKIQLRFLFNYSLNRNNVKRYKEAIDLCNKGIILCKQHGFLYSFGEFHYQKGQNLIDLGRKKEALKFLEKAKMIFDIQDNELFANIADKEIKKLQKSLEMTVS
ncbi:helix-turn-helix domain-containing protein [Halalkalibacterium halodurans]|uniref:BH1814 protein n=1 Tax=Halalkalibacterium halodurans (strain ATCC BAA-125 / DSM 18197 / FERM 7344 / JCM 9153 / C-125) TaxID=272558 RepID=Q9KBW0_HALH5|nr:helix-turn-helix domain-containing protein [Halalkalibacterium halodurans]MED3646342.1 helix-turn-helix domain-containing protein [Halalkalibacterium halodurans]MED4082319.1 helix-turn-helix domain-containing protein [Halalkalibacterium halodurans]MED4083530.1 helix-turn-helix domain-containing protein [Halalkalibacterium halodurans]MED4105843.1 helix-turn-helix domain-containing protein [Halalkalibacterium halodurans]MED4109955.1 helix-turn-helix domain-containing protein [Halalkalibacteri